MKVKRSRAIVRSSNHFLKSLCICRKSCSTRKRMSRRKCPTIKWEPGQTQAKYRVKVQKPQKHEQLLVFDLSKFKVDLQCIGNNAIPIHVPRRGNITTILVPGTTYKCKTALGARYKQTHPLEFLSSIRRKRKTGTYIPKHSLLLYLGSFDCTERLLGGENNGLVRTITCVRHVFLFNDYQFILGDTTCLIKS